MAWYFAIPLGFVAVITWVVLVNFFVQAAEWFKRH